MKIDLPAWAAWFDVKRAPDGHPVRHRVLFGGRGGAKSWTVAQKLVERARRSPEQILCVREFQNSIGASSKQLIEDCIRRTGLSDFFTITGDEIRGKNGSRFIFVGLHGRETALKSFEGFTLCWVEEAVSVSQVSIDTLIPTIRKPGSEIWWTFNPRYRTDPVDLLFRAGNPPPGSIICEVHAQDNPWFPDVLARGRDYDRSRDPQKHAHIWGGGYLERSDAQVFTRWQIAIFEAPSDTVFYLGCDWGYSQDPTVLVRCFIGRWSGEPGRSEVIADQNGDCLFVDHEAYSLGCEIDDIPALLAGTDTRSPPRWRNAFGRRGVPGALKWFITADSSRPEIISKIKDLGFNIKPAKKGKDSVDEGITFLQSYEIFVHPRCQHMADELLSYRWKVDRLTDQILPQPADTNNHVIDALRYALEGVRHSTHVPFEFMSSGPSELSKLLEHYQFGDRGGLPLHLTAGSFGERREEDIFVNPQRIYDSRRFY